MALDKAMKNLKFDVRLTEFNLNNGNLTQSELDAHLAKIPDSAAQAENVNLDGRNKAAATADDSSETATH